ncbi:CapA family protein [Cellulomonas fimi]|uniref:CapA family protein n=1 Tax=Cellulomonas fimi TaxID=1708 RepID=UPI001E3C574F|nr:CapA family protein [Cellulomonas fimi]
MHHARARRRRSPVALVAAGVLVALAAAAGATATTWTHPAGAAATPAPVPAASASPVPAPDPAGAPGPTASTPPRGPDPDVELTIVAAGDVLPHLPVLSSARTATGGYDLAPLLAPLDGWVRPADLALCHVEVPVAPAGTEPSGYPLFGTVASLAQGLRDGGWDGCSTASNHAVDRGFAGVAATLDALDAAGLGHVGTARTPAEQAQPQLYRLERGGRSVTVAHLAATYGTNGMPVDADKPWSVDRIDVPALVAAATAARAAGADLVVASIHCCTEYRTEPTAEQVAIDQQLADSGVVDLVLGHHAHVPQPVALLPGGPRGEGMWVAYGLGNLLSNQDEACCSPETASGLLLTAHVRAAGADPGRGVPAGPARVTSVEWTPVTVDRRGGHRVHALVDVPQGTATLSAAQVTDRTARVVAAVGTQAPERRVPVSPSGPPPVVVLRSAG